MEEDGVLIIDFTELIFNHLAPDRQLAIGNMQ
jgi:hypothetical protein